MRQTFSELVREHLWTYNPAESPLPPLPIAVEFALTGERRRHIWMRFTDLTEWRYVGTPVYSGSGWSLEDMEDEAERPEE